MARFDGERQARPCSGPLSLVVWIGLTMAACASTVPAAAPTEAQPLYVAPASFDFGSNPELLARIKASPHRYFRFINIPFSAEVCRRFRAGELPQVNLHGDAHLEQYAVTDLGRGLTDFDDSSSGPAILDLLRFMVSVELAAEERGWSAQQPEIEARFLAGYRQALTDPTFVAPEPTASKRFRDAFAHDRPKYFEWLKTVMGPIEPGTKAELERSMGSYVEMQRQLHPELRPEFFEPVDIGSLKMGIGSALDQKFLVRIKAATDAPEDDLVLEVKEIRSLKGIDCVVARGNEALRILVAQSRIAYEPYRYLGHLHLGGRSFWIHSWVDNYRELSIDKSFSGPEEMGELAFDVGVQLGLGHPKQIAAPMDLQLRRDLLEMLDTLGPTLLETRRVLAAQTRAAWERFNREPNPAKTLGP